MAAVAVDGRHVGAVDPVMLESLIKGFDAHGAHPFSDQVANRIIHHGSHHAGVQAEAVGQVGGHVIFAAAGMHLPFGGFAEGDDAWIDPVIERAKRNQVERAFLRDVPVLLP